jgi:(R,R)-butanediol dehydrogenase/meso-butanediol dehydrogenase/diacetyl reductase
MKSARYYGVRDIRVEEVASRRVKKGEVKVEIEWCGICGSDMHEYVAGPMVVTNPPVTLGHEFSGVVVEVGEDVSHVKLGDRVAIDHCSLANNAIVARKDYTKYAKLSV